MLTARILRAFPAGAALLLPLTLSITACRSEESKRVRALAGTYVHVSETDPRTHPSRVHLYQRRVLTLRADRHWAMTHDTEVNGEKFPSAADSGTFRLRGVTLAMNSEGNGVQQYTVKGDTLWRESAREVAMTKMVTGMDIEADESFLVRQR